MQTARSETARNRRRAEVTVVAVVLRVVATIAMGVGSVVAAAAAPAQETDLERLRREGAVAFERAIARLASRHEDLQRLRARYARDCTGRVDQPWSSKRSRTRSLEAIPVWKADLPECRSLSKDMDELAATIRQRVEDAEERARRHGVYPGTLRETRRAHGLESAEFGR